MTCSNLIRLIVDLDTQKAARASQRKMQMDAENAAALRALQGPGPLAATHGLRLRGFTTCPHCHEGFGSASFAIHVRRCRALYPPPESESVALEEDEVSLKPVKPKKPKKPKPMHSLVDL